MKVLFLCGSLEPGEDGVGDYVRRLAGELILQQHETAIIALYDWKIQQDFSGFQLDGTTQIPVLRLPAAWTIKKRIDLAKQWTASFSPEWISLQYVPYSFDNRGLTFGLSSFLKKLGEGRKWHFMFHELWLVSKSLLTFKRFVTGNIQMVLIQQLIKKLQPAVIHTQTQLSQNRLAKIGFTAKFLPLFSNIPVVFQKSPQDFMKQENNIRIVSFGSIYPNALIEEFSKDAAKYEKKHNTTITLIIAGRSGALEKQWVSAWQAVGLKVEHAGEQPPGKISEILSKGSVGLSSTPFVMSEKSGTVAAMREHGLPVICIADPYDPKDFIFYPPDGIIEYSKTSFEKCLAYKPSVKDNVGVSVVTRNFANELLACY